MRGIAKFDFRCVIKLDMSDNNLLTYLKGILLIRISIFESVWNIVKPVSLSIGSIKAMRLYISYGSLSVGNYPFWTIVDILRLPPKKT